MGITEKDLSQSLGNKLTIGADAFKSIVSTESTAASQCYANSVIKNNDVIVKLGEAEIKWDKKFIDLFRK